MFTRGFMRPVMVATASGFVFKRKMAKASAPSYKHTSSTKLATPALSALPITSTILATGDWQGIIYLQDSNNSQWTLEQHGPVRSIANLTDTMFATSDLSRICVWDIEHQKLLHAFGPERSGTISDMVGFPNGLLAVVRWGTERVEIWDTNAGEMKWSLGGHTDDVKYVAALQNNRLASYGWDLKIRIWNLANGECERVIETGYAGSLKARPDDTLVTTDLAGVKLWVDGECTKTIEMSDFPWRPCLAITPEGKVLINAFKTAFRVVDLPTNETKDVYYSFLCPDDIVCMQDGRVVTFGPGRAMNVFNV